LASVRFELNLHYYLPVITFINKKKVKLLKKGLEY
jgi:hypothetical protein